MLLLLALGCAGATASVDPRPELLRVARARSEALVRRDEPALDRILADDFVYTNASGEVLDKATYLSRYVRDPEVRWLAQDLDDVAIRVSGDTAVLTFRVHDRATFGAHALDARFRSTFVYVRTAGGWRCVAGHSSPDAAPP